MASDQWVDRLLGVRALALALARNLTPRRLHSVLNSTDRNIGSSVLLDWCFIAQHLGVATAAASSSYRACSICSGFETTRDTVDIWLNVKSSQVGHPGIAGH